MATGGPEFPDDPGFRDRISQRGEEAVGQFVQAMLENPAMSQALQTAFGARERASQAQQSALGALNLPTAGDLERLTRRLRSLSHRLEAIEDGIDRLEQRLVEIPARAEAARGDATPPPGVESTLEEMARDIAALRKRLGDTQDHPRDQASLDVTPD
ncbi:MAG: hypothetical protein ACR2NA_11280 [Solirubrobacterales bacterium]